MSILNWQLREALPELRPEGRLNVLVSMLCHCNVRLRCYPSVQLLIKETGFASKPVTAAKHWLADHSAYMLVPYQHRIGDELKLPIRHQVYQMTGILRLDDGLIVPYLYLTPEALTDIVNALAEITPTEISLGETSSGENKGSYINQDSYISKVTTLTAPGKTPGAVQAKTPNGKQPPKAKRTRKPNPLFDAVARLAQADPDVAGASINKIAVQLADGKKTADDVNRLYDLWWGDPFNVKNGRPPRLWDIPVLIGRVTRPNGKGAGTSASGHTATPDPNDPPGAYIQDGRKYTASGADITDYTAQDLIAARALWDEETGEPHHPTEAKP